MIRLLLALAAAGTAIGLLVLRAAGHGAFLIGPSLIGPSREVAAFLTDLRDGRYAQAYARICPAGAEDRASFLARSAAARDRGHGVASFELRTTFGDDSLSLTSTVGNVSFRDGTTTSVLFDMGPSNSRRCIPAVGYEDLLG